MKARPILFSGPMIRALLEGRKTQTRRVMKPAFGPKHPILNLAEHGESDRGYSGRFNDPDSWGYPYAEDGADMQLSQWPELCPYGAKGDLLWVRETCCLDWADNPVYKADGGSAREAGYSSEPRWRPSIHMPRRASRLTLRITDVRVQRLQDISEDDAESEGAKKMHIDDLGQSWKSHKRGFQSLWESINGPGSWDANSWVWAISFEVIKANVDTVMEASR